TAILDQINNIVLIINPECEVLFVSASVKKILGFESEVLLGSGWWSKTIVDGDIVNLKSSVGDSIMLTRNTGGVQTERKVMTSYGSEKWFLWNTTLAEDGNIIS